MILVRSFLIFQSMTVKKASCKRFNFILPPKYLDYAVNFELFYRNICNLGILSNEDLDFVKTRTKEAALFSYQNFNNKVPTTTPF